MFLQSLIHFKQLLFERQTLQEKIVKKHNPGSQQLGDVLPLVKKSLTRQQENNTRADSQSSYRNENGKQKCLITRSLELENKPPLEDKIHYHCDRIGNDISGYGRQNAVYKEQV